MTKEVIIEKCMTFFTEEFEVDGSKISNDAKLKLDYDKQKFQNIFDAEMKKLASEQ